MASLASENAGDFIEAVTNWDLKTVKELITNVDEETKTSALFQAIKLPQKGNLFGKSYRIIAFLINNGADVNKIDDKGSNALHHAILNKETKRTTLSLLLRSMTPDSINWINNKRNTPLMTAVETEQESVVKRLLQLGADPDIELNDRWNILHRIAWHKFTNPDNGVKIVALLLKDMSIDSVNLKTPPDKNTSEEFTPLDLVYEFANESNRRKIIKLIREKGGHTYAYRKKIIKTYERKFPKGTPLIVACEKGYSGHVELLIDDYPSSSGSSKDYMNAFGKDSEGNKSNPLIAAAKNERVNVITYLLSMQVNPSITDSNNYNALHLAAWYNTKNTYTIELLLDHMSITSINQLNGEERTPLDLVFESTQNRSFRKKDLVQKFEDRGGLANCYIIHPTTKRGTYRGPGNGLLGVPKAEQDVPLRQNSNYMELKF